MRVGQDRVSGPRCWRGIALYVCFGFPYTEDCTAVLLSRVVFIMIDKIRDEQQGISVLCTVRNLLLVSVMSQPKESVHVGSLAL